IRRSALAGSIATADRLIRTMVEEVGITLADAVEMSSGTPARLIGVDDRKGRIAPGYDADIVIYDRSITPIHVLVAGRSIL
ncbi:MAG: amidohydrolase family protein, partial [Muribaculaceae bacterium]|nr:amidohydrolase family protein [Muribaculaceae bacterium]